MRRHLINPTGDSHQFIEFLYSHPSHPKSYNLDKRANLKCYDCVYLWLKAPVDLWRKKTNPLKTCWREQKYNFRAMMRRDHKSHLGSPQDDNDKDVSICVQTLREIGWIASQWELHTFYLFWRGFHWWKPRKTAGGEGGWSISPRKKPKQKPVCFLSFGVDALNWQSFTEIGEMACSMTAQCSRGTLLIVKIKWTAMVRRNEF